MSITKKGQTCNRLVEFRHLLPDLCARLSARCLRRRFADLFSAVFFLGRPAVKAGDIERIVGVTGCAEETEYDYEYKWREGGIHIDKEITLCYNQICLWKSENLFCHAIQRLFRELKYYNGGTAYE